MPTILRISGLRIVIYPTDHRPSHVHVIGADSEAVFILNCPDGPPESRENYGFKRTDLSAITAALIKALTAICQQWSSIHGAH